MFIHDSRIISMLVDDWRNVLVSATLFGLNSIPKTIRVWVPNKYG